MKGADNRLKVKARAWHSVDGSPEQPNLIDELRHKLCYPDYRIPVFLF